MQFHPSPKLTRHREGHICWIFGLGFWEGTHDIQAEIWKLAPCMPLLLNLVPQGWVVAPFQIQFTLDTEAFEARPPILW
jgi:hypothetical protein